MLKGEAPAFLPKAAREDLSDQRGRWGTALLALLDEPQISSQAASPFRYYISSPEVIRPVLRMYVNYLLSLRNVEDLLAWDRSLPRAGADVVEPVRATACRRHPPAAGELDVQ